MILSVTSQTHNGHHLLTEVAWTSWSSCTSWSSWTSWTSWTSWSSWTSDVLQPSLQGARVGGALLLQELQLRGVDLRQADALRLHLQPALPLQTQSAVTAGHASHGGGAKMC